MRLPPFDQSKDRVLYEQVADRLQEQIVSGIFKPGDRLPSIRKLKQQLAVSFSTVTEAYRLLEDRGLVEARTCMEDNTKKQLVELITRYEVPLIEDDVYGELHFEGTRPNAIKAFDTQNQVIYCSSISKTLSPGLRVGWCSGGCHHLKVVHRKLVTNRMSAIAPQLVVAAFLANGGYDRHLRHLRQVYHAQRDRMLQAISNYFPAETCATHPTGGTVLWIAMPEGFDAIQLYESALQKGISIAPGPIFSASNERYHNCFALNTTLPWSDTVNRAMQTLGYLIKKQMAVSFLESSP